MAPASLPTESVKSQPLTCNAAADISAFKAEPFVYMRDRERDLRDMCKSDSDIVFIDGGLLLGLWVRVFVCFFAHCGIRLASIALRPLASVKDDISITIAIIMHKHTRTTLHGQTERKNKTTKQNQHVMRKRTFVQTGQYIFRWIYIFVFVEALPSYTS